MDDQAGWGERLHALQERIGFDFEQRDLLTAALTHRSFTHEYPDTSGPDNQRLEFLGDSVVGFLVAEWLFWRYQDAREGDLTRLRSHIVHTEGLAALARELGIGPALRLGKGEASRGGSQKAAILCDSFEALVGAMFLDQGLQAVRRWLRALLERHADRIDGLRTRQDAKTRLQEMVQGQMHETPIYHIVSDEGPDHAKVFTAQVLIDGVVWGEGKGSSKQAAEQDAAATALQTHSDLSDDSF